MVWSLNHSILYNSGVARAMYSSILLHILALFGERKEVFVCMQGTNLTRMWLDLNSLVLLPLQ